MSEVEPFPNVLVDAVVAALNVDDDDGNFWIELKHMESNSFDLAWQQPAIRGAILSRYESPLYDRGEELPHPAERQLVLQLRDRLREELSRPPLSDHERRSWAYDRLEWKFHSFTGSHEEFKVAQGLSAQQIDFVVDHVKKTAPHIVDYMRSASEHNRPFLDAKDFHNTQIIGCGWISSYVTDQVCRLIDPDGLVRTLESQIEIEKRLWEEAA